MNEGDAKETISVLGQTNNSSFLSTKEAPPSEMYPRFGIKHDLPKQHGNRFL